MAKFSFRLQTLLKLRAAVRDQYRGELAQAFEAEQIIEQQSAQLAEQLAGVQDRMHAATQPGEVDVDGLLQSHRFELILRSQQQELSHRATQLAEEVDRRRRKLVEADRQVRVLERLQERQECRHIDEQAKKDVFEMDEVAGAAWRRNVIDSQGQT